MPETKRELKCYRFEVWVNGLLSSAHQEKPDAIFEAGRQAGVTNTIVVMELIPKPIFKA